MLRSRGFSIIEVMISFTVLTVAVLALLGLMPVAARQQMSSDLQNQALCLAQANLDFMLAKKTTPNPSTQTYGPGGAVSNPAYSARYTVVSTLGTDTNNPGCSLATVTVGWVEQGRPRSVSLSTLVAP